MASMLLKILTLAFQLSLILWIFCENCYSESGDCIVSGWGEWAACSKNCSTDGTKTRTRKVLKNLTSLFAKQCPPDLQHSVPCGIANNGCEQFCDESNGKCGCKSGLKLSTDYKTCIDHNECLINFGRGPCTQRCINSVGSYRCECNPSYFLAEDKHNCHFNESAYPCNFETHKYDDNDVCICKDSNREGLKCNRDKSACKNTNDCGKEKVCIKFVHSTQKCVDKDFLVPILLPLPFENYIEGDFRYLVEVYITQILEGIFPKKPLFQNVGNIHHKNNVISNQFFYVEGTKSQRSKTFTFSQFIVLDAKDFSPVDKNIVCSKLYGTDVHCLNSKECNILKSDGKNCLFVYADRITSEEEKSSSKAWVIALVVCLVILVLIVLLILYFKRRGKWKQITMTFNRRNEEVSCINESPLLRVNEPPPPYTANDGDNLQHIGNFDTHVFRNEPSKKDTGNPSNHVYESVENLKLKLPDYTEYEAMESCGKKDLHVDLSEEFEEPRYLASSPIPREGQCSSSNAEQPMDSDEHYATPSNKPLVESGDDDVLL